MEDLNLISSREMLACGTIINLVDQKASKNRLETLDKCQPKNLDLLLVVKFNLTLDLPFGANKWYYRPCFGCTKETKRVL